MADRTKPRVSVQEGRQSFETRSKKINTVRVPVI